MNKQQEKLLVEKVIRPLVRKVLKEGMTAQLSMVMMSHLSDISESDPKNRKRAEFVKYLIMKYVPNKEIDPDQEWSEYTQKHR